jgi:hypothetical protein
MNDKATFPADQPQISDAGDDRLLTVIRWVLSVALVILIYWLSRDWIHELYDRWDKFFYRDLPEHFGISVGMFALLASFAEAFRHLWRLKRKEGREKIETLFSSGETERHNDPAEIEPE